MENPIELGAEGASVKRNSQAKGQRHLFETFDLYRLFVLGGQSVFYCGETHKVYITTNTILNEI